VTQSGRRDGAAIASAIDDAIGIPGAVTEFPITPQRLNGF
jgi:carbon-monoxide dehydrogenase large subunit/6-hydroxypseudooxynicotine dehydrogenase subunit gamma